MIASAIVDHRTPPGWDAVIASRVAWAVYEPQRRVFQCPHNLYVAERHAELDGCFRHVLRDARNDRLLAQQPRGLIRPEW